MAWNHRAAVVAMAVAIQPTPGVFAAPNRTTDLLAVSVSNNSDETLTTTDPTSTGSIWEAARIVLGVSSNVGGTIPLRGPGGSAPFAANAWPQGRVLQACGFAEIIQASAVSTVLQAGSDTKNLVLANTASSTDDFLIGAPIQTALIGSGFKQTAIITDYVGSTRTATIGSTMGGSPATGAAYTIPAHVRYVLTPMTSAPPLLSISVWRDKKRYDYRDYRPSSFKIDMPVTNEANQSSSSIDFAGKGVPVADEDDTTPPLLDDVLGVAVPPVRNGKFAIDYTLLGHASYGFSTSLELGAASNQNAEAGQDGYDILKGTRTIEVDMNASDNTTFNLKQRTDNQTVMPVMSTWGMGPGNYFGWVNPRIVLDPLSSGERNGYVSRSGNAAAIGVDKSAALTIWW